MRKLISENSDFIKVTVVSAHEGSSSWVKMLNFIGRRENVELNYVTIISDNQYRSSNAIQRVVNKLLIYLLFPLKVLAFYRRIYREDFIIVVTSPFYLPLLAALLFKSEKLLVLHNDLYPEGFSQIYFLKKIPYLFGFYRFISDKLLYKISNNIFLSKSHLQSRDYLNKCIIHTPAVSRVFRENKHLFNSQQRCNIGYIGTMGYNHCGIEFLSLLKGSKFNSHIEFNFNISGSLVNKFQSKVLNGGGDYNLNRRVRVSGALSESDYHDTMLKTDFGLILLSPNGGDVVFPSKFSAHLSYGHPVIIISDQKNDLHEFVVKNSIGVSINISSHDLNDLNDFINDMSYNTLRCNALAAYEEYFHYENIAKAFIKKMK